MVWLEAITWVVVLLGRMFGGLGEILVGGMGVMPRGRQEVGGGQSHAEWCWVLEVSVGQPLHQLHLMSLCLHG